jgi:hypothetical protein
MTLIKLLSAGLIAIAMLATPAVARENYLAKRHVVEEAYASGSPIARYIRVPALRVGASINTSPNCDVGDNPHVC